jgi:spore germination protein YaaH
MTRRQLIGPGVLAIVAIAVLALTVPRTPDDPSASPGTSDARATDGATGTPRPAPKHEVYGYLPYWEMDDGIAEHVNDTALTTLGLFSVTNERDGSLDTSQNGYKRITGDLGARLIKDAHDRGARVELVFTSFGETRNDRLFGSVELQDATIASLVALATDLGVDGINVDVERPGLENIPAYAGFVTRLRGAAVAANPDAQVSVATTAGPTGAAMAAAASAAGADRIFLMGYDYRTAGSSPGASAPLDRRDGEQDLAWSLDLYESLGVPVERTILGLPLYGVTWPVAGPALGEAQVGAGDTWFPNDNLGLLASPPVPPETDQMEQVEFYAIPPADGSTPDPSDGAPADGWRAIYVDSPATLSPKLALANERGLAGAGFWAIGYDRGQPDVTALIAKFRAGELD